MRKFLGQHKLLVIALPLTLLVCIAAFVGVMQWNRAREARSYVEEGDRYLADLNYEQAIICYQQALHIDEKHRGANLGIAECYEIGGQNVYAEAIYRAMLERNPGDEEVYPKLAELLIRTDKPSEAKTLIAEAAEHLPKSASISDWYRMTHPTAPVMDYDAGDYDTRIQVTVTADAGDIIYYTTDGSDPTVLSQVYTAPIVLRNGKNTLRAIAVNTAGFESTITDAVYNINIADAEITVQDPVIEGIIRSYLDLSWGEPIYNDDIAQITSLYIIGDGLYHSAQAPAAIEYRNDGGSVSIMHDGWSNEYDLNDRSGGLRTLADLQYMPFLHTLNIACQQELDISGIVLAPSLESVSILGCGLESSDIAPLASLSSLVQLSLGWNEITDISALSALKLLETLSVWDNGITDLSPVSSLTALTVLDFSDNAVADISPVASLSALRELWMYGNAVTALAPVQNLDALEVLMLRGNPIADPESVRAIYPHLTRIDVDLLGLAEQE